ncbi:MAG: HAD hydrolase-like protein, partial [Rickettsiales bacterium]|nr:HAD hydrolase-like protein [Rickettsiales bacterium]
HPNLMSIADKFDAFLFDASGVLWDGREFYPGVFDTMRTLREAGKAVYVLSNTALLGEDAVARHLKRGTDLGEYCDLFITSGDAAREVFLAGGLAFENNPAPAKFVHIGRPDPKLFEGTQYTEVESAEEADFFYISIPQKSAPVHGFVSYENKKSTPEKPQFDFMDASVFEPELREFLRLGLPGVNVNPDLRAATEDKNSGEIHYVARQGAVAQAYEAMGGEIVEFGKPHRGIYEYAFARLGERALDKSRIAMIGDTLRTDIKGANGAGIKGVLCVENGVVAEALAGGATLEKLIEIEDGKPDFLIKSV